MSAVIEQFQDGNSRILLPKGSWIIDEARELDLVVRDAMSGAGLTADGATSAVTGTQGRRITIDVCETEALDTAGAFLLVRMELAWIAAGGTVDWLCTDKARLSLIQRVRTALTDDEPELIPRGKHVLDEIGETVIGVGQDGKALLSMLGSVMTELGRTILSPRSFRTAAVINQIEYAGLRAVPIVALMSFLVGGIVAQQGAFQLRYFGAEIFTIDLVGILALRELSLILTAIMLAGRSGSAITAEIGSMKMNEEIDALKVIGMDPVNVLVLPRAVALVIVLPLLTFLAGMATLLGAMLTLWVYSDIEPIVFVTKLHEAIDFSSLFSGLFKAPFMALIIALIACTEGMAVRGSAESLGQRTTASVVKSIFMVIVVDGIFAMFYAAIDF
ncbi:MAG TPA: ABC transporter permease [Afifellaceae bacterium]|nr:ABC transporter permease [Afifellaceae bacterium]